MEIQDLRYFQEIAAAGSLSRAAARLSVSQPTLSRQLRKLEDEVRTPLFYRNGRGVSLTSSGRRLLEVSASALDQLSSVKGELHAGKFERDGDVTIEIPSSLAIAVASDLARLFSEAHPYARLRVVESAGCPPTHANPDERTDVAVFYKVGSSCSERITPLLVERLYLVEPASAMKGGTADLAEFADQPCLLPGTDIGLRKVIDAACAIEGVKITPRFEVDSIAVLKQLVEQGCGASIMTFGAVAREVAERRLTARPIIGQAMAASLVMTTPPNKPVTLLSRTIIRLLHAAVQHRCKIGTLEGGHFAPLPVFGHAPDDLLVTSA